MAQSEIDFAHDVFIAFGKPAKDVIALVAARDAEIRAEGTTITAELKRELIDEASAVLGWENIFRIEATDIVNRILQRLAIRARAAQPAPAVIASGKGGHDNSPG